MIAKLSKLEEVNLTVRFMDANTLLGNVTCAAKKLFSSALVLITYAKNIITLTKLPNLKTVEESIARWECPIRQQVETQ